MEDWSTADYPVQLIGVGKSAHMSYLGNWIDPNDAPVCVAQSLLGYPTWNEWGANQRDLFILDHEGNVISQMNIFRDELQIHVFDVIQ